MVKIAVFEKDRPDENGADRRGPRHPSQLLQREIHVLQRQDCSGEHPVRGSLAEVDGPIAAGAYERVGDVRITDEEEALGKPDRV